LISSGSVTKEDESVSKDGEEVIEMDSPLREKVQITRKTQYFGF